MEALQGWLIQAIKNVTGARTWFGEAGDTWGAGCCLCQESGFHSEWAPWQTHLVVKPKPCAQHLYQDRDDIWTILLIPASTSQSVCNLVKEERCYLLAILKSQHP